MNTENNQRCSVMDNEELCNHYLNETCFECITEFVCGQRIVTYDNKKFCDEDCLCEYFLWRFGDELDEINYYSDEHGE